MVVTGTEVGARLVVGTLEVAETVAVGIGVESMGPFTTERGGGMTWIGREGEATGEFDCAGHRRVGRALARKTTNER